MTMTATKRLPLLLCVLAVLLVFPGIALAGDHGPQAEGPEAFTIAGYTTFYDYRTLPSGRTKFYLTADGTVTGDLEGPFHFEEWGMVDLDPVTGEGSGQGTNRGIMTIVADGGDEVVVAFGGRSTADTVSGRFTVLEGTGMYDGLHGRGTYEGEPYSVFVVNFTFTRSFYTHSD
jgi:hypothetical protein